MTIKFNILKLMGVFFVFYELVKFYTGRGLPNNNIVKIIKNTAIPQLFVQLKGRSVNVRVT